MYPFKKQHPEYKLAVILDFQTEKLRHTTKEWNTSFEHKTKILKNLRKEAGTDLDKTIFIDRFKELVEKGCFN